MSIHQGHADPEIRRQYGNDTARLVYGWDPVEDKLFHISQARRGLACGLICPHCKGVLVAHLKDDRKAAHFAHYGPACGDGPETALHILCKEIVRDELRLGFPIDGVYATLHRGSVVIDEPIAVASEQRAPGVRIPPPPVEVGLGHGVKFDHARLERLRSETAAMSDLLAGITAFERSRPREPHPPP